MWFPDPRSTIDAHFVGKRLPSVPPVLFIKYGPPGSGKGSSVMATARRRAGGGVTKASTVTVDLDAIVASSEKFQQVLGTTTAAAAPTARLRRAYTDARKNGANAIADEIMKRALEDGFNLEIETTGANLSSVFQYIRQGLGAGFRVIVVYPIVPLSDLLTRVKTRWVKTRQIPAESDFVAVAAKSAVRNIEAIARYADAVYIVDNAAMPPRLITEVKMNPSAPLLPNGEIRLRSTRCTVRKETRPHLSEFESMLSRVCAA